jgi:thioredoxin 1
MSPILQEVKAEIGDAANIIKIDVDKNPQVAHNYQIMGVPTLMIFKNGKVLWRQSGVVPKVGLVNVLRQYV